MNDNHPPPVPATARFRWLLFLAVMLSPVVLTVLTVLLGARSGETAPMIAVFGGGAAGIICGILLGRWLGKTMPAKIIISLLFALTMVVVCIGMSCGGCLASNYDFSVN
jgi:hypothetical protein